MFNRTFGLLAALLLWSASLPALAHVKWFLHGDEQELMSQPKPELFTRLSFENVLIVSLGLSTLLAVFILSRRFANSAINQRLVAMSTRFEPVVSLFIGVFTAAY